MITLYFTQPDTSAQAINQWCDFLLMADAMGRSISLAIDEKALPLIYQNSALAKRFKALSYTDMESISIGARSCDKTILALFEEAGVHYILCDNQEFSDGLAKATEVISL